MDNTEELEKEQAMLSEEKKAKSFWYADWAFPITVGIMAAAVFAGTHMYCRTRSRSF